MRSENDDEATAKRIGLKIDREWTDLLWFIGMSIISSIAVF